MTVSIVMITYNHEIFIREAIDGVVMQETNFEYELILANDCSTDNSDTVIQNHINKYPNKNRIKYFNHKVNKGMIPNFMFALEQAQGKYIAICEGDDYWTDPKKIQKQVDFLDANPDYGLVHHEADYLFQKNGEIIKNHHKKNGIVISDGFVFEELLKNNNIYTPTVLFNKNLFERFKAINENTSNEFLMGDYVMWLEFSQHSKFHYLPQSMAVYRVLENSASKSSAYEKALLFLNSYFDIRLFFINRYAIKNINVSEIEQWRLNASLSLAIKYKRNKEARSFASKLKINNRSNLLKRLLVNTPVIFRYIQKKNKL